MSGTTLVDLDFRALEVGGDKNAHVRALASPETPSLDQANVLVPDDTFQKR